MNQGGPRIRQMEDGTYLLEFERVDSTQLEARRRRQRGEVKLLGVRADYQTAGHGRRGAMWYAPPREALLVTYLADGIGSDASSQALLAMAAGIAVARAIRDITALEASVRWPNDILVGDRKVGGVVIEMFPAVNQGGVRTMVAAIGIGVNVNVATWPDHLSRTATSLYQASARLWPIEAVEASVRTALWPLVRRISRGDRAKVLELWRRWDSTAGVRYEYPTVGGSEVGVAAAVTDKGELVLRLPNGREITVVQARHVP